MKICFIIVFIVLFLFYLFLFYLFYLEEVEGFEGNVWPKHIISEFLKFERTFYPKLDIDLNILMKQASVNEVKYLMKNYKWPWSKELQEEYKEAIRRHPVIKSIPEESLLEAQRVYNENAMKQLLFYNTKEGAFVLDGVSVGPEKVYKCSEKNNLEKIEFMGYDSIYGNVLTNISKVENDNIPREIPGFSFLSGSCNPCSNLDTGNMTCAYSVKNIRDSNNLIL